ncbi:MAG: hypothetical protein ACRCTK_02965 [Alphaproteobacteria bacterium]
MSQKKELDGQDVLGPKSKSVEKEEASRQALLNCKEDNEKISSDSKMCISFQTLSQKQALQLRKNLGRRKSQQCEKDKKNS